MKALKMILASLVVFGALTVTEGCKKDVDETGTSTTPNLSDKGGIAFKVKDKSGNAIPNARVGLATSQADLATNTYLASKNTDSDGYASLGKFTAGNYYYEVDVTVGDTPYHGDGAVQITKGEDTTKELTLE